MDVYYRIASNDAAWNNTYWASNRIHRRPLRTAGRILKPATAEAKEVVLTDEMRGTDTWPVYLDAVAGPPFDVPVGGLPAHTHPLAGTTGSAGG